MKPICPHCQTPLQAGNIHVAKDSTHCHTCQKSYKISDLIPLIEERETNTPPSDSKIVINHINQNEFEIIFPYSIHIIFRILILGFLTFALFKLLKLYLSAWQQGDVIIIIAGTFFLFNFLLPFSVFILSFFVKNKLIFKDGHLISQHKIWHIKLNANIPINDIKYIGILSEKDISPERFPELSPKQLKALKKEMPNEASLLIMTDETIIPLHDLHESPFQSIDRHTQEWLSAYLNKRIFPSKEESTEKIGNQNFIPTNSVIICKKGRHAIPLENTNIPKNIAYCETCDSLHKMSDSKYLHRLDSPPTPTGSKMRVKETGGDFELYYPRRIYNKSNLSHLVISLLPSIGIYMLWHHQETIKTFSLPYIIPILAFIVLATIATLALLILIKNIVKEELILYKGDKLHITHQFIWRKKEWIFPISKIYSIQLLEEKDFNKKQFPQFSKRQLLSLETSSSEDKNAAVITNEKMFFFLENAKDEEKEWAVNTLSRKVILQKGR